MRSTINKYLLQPLYLYFFFLHLVVFISVSSTVHYNATDLIALNCGSSTTNSTDSSGRIWTGENDSRFSYIEHESIISTVSATDVPYTTARLSYYEFTYSLPLTSGPKFIRLHFYPVSYSNYFDRSNGFFSVSAGSYTLLTNFNASFSADADKVHVFFKEFIVHVQEDERLKITFTPRQGNYAFINGIEVVSMPLSIYYSAPQNVGPDYNLRIENNMSVETVYRINVGGQDIEAVDDTGMFRTWVKDVDYLTDARPSGLTSNWNASLKSTYAAPDEVYLTARTMGPNKSVNNGYNLTWEFPVHSAFMYLVRLHFCEFQKEITKPYDRIFQIFIADQTAEKMADVIASAGGNDIPIYKDYAVVMARQGTEKKVNLSVKLHPALESQKTRYSDAILNGREIFKLSRTDYLSNPNLDPSPITPPPAATPTKKSKSKSNHITIISVTVGVALGLLIVGFLIFLRGKKIKMSAARKKTKRSKTDNSSLPSDFDSCQHFSLAEIKKATNNFDKVLIIGVGGFGNVYKGSINNRSTPVAIKRLNPDSQQGAHEFMTEIEMLSQLKYIHLVSLIGYCNDDHEMILVYDYMAHGTLRGHLNNSDNPHLSWKQRLEICVGAALGLHYLHSGTKHPIIHRDVKTTNILLDKRWVAKVSDFGLSKMGPSFSKTHVSTVVKGSFGYLDPEYYRRHRLTEKSDVYSFGVVLFEVLTAKPPLIRTEDNEHMSLAEWARHQYHNGELDQMVDDNLRGEIEPKCLKKFGEIAMSCLVDNGIQRPSMKDVVWGLEFALQLQKSAEEGIELGRDVLMGSAIDNRGTNSDDDNRLMSGTGIVFSELMEPRGR